MSLIIRNARILTLAAGARPRRGAELRELAVVPGGDVLVADGVVAAVGPKLEAPAGAESIDANGRVLMPAFVDCHTHACWAGSGMEDWEERLRGVPQPEILRRGGGILATVRAVREATKKQLAAGLRERLARMLCEGTTTVEVKSGYGLTTEAELKMLRAIVRAGQDWAGTVVPTALLGQWFEGAPEDYARMVVKEMLPEVSREFPGIAVDAGAEEGGWSREACVRLLERASKRHPLRVHADQSSPLGMVPEAIRLHARSADHLEACTKADLVALAKSETCGVVMPCAGFHGDGRFARAGFLVDQGGAVALATGCSPSAAPVHSMPFAIALAVRCCGLTPHEAIAACTVNAAAVLGLADRGTVEVGRRADLILLHHTDERMLAFEVGGNPVDLVVCAGRAARGPSEARAAAPGPAPA